MLHALDRRDQECPGAAGGVEHRGTWFGVVAGAVECVFSEPIGRVVLAQGMPKRSGQKPVVQLFQEVLGELGAQACRAGLVVLQPSGE